MNFTNPVFVRLSQRRRNEEGFTLVELMVVVLIIGILVAIAIPVFLNAQNGARSASAKADAKNVITETQSYYANNNAVPTLAQLGTPLQGETIVALTANVTAEGVYYNNGTVIAKQGTSPCYKATHTGTNTFFAKGDCTTTPLTTNGAAW